MVAKFKGLSLLAFAVAFAGCSSADETNNVVKEGAQAQEGSGAPVMDSAGSAAPLEQPESRGETEMTEAVQAAVDAFIGAPAVASVARTPYGALYEVVLNSGQLVYTDAKVSFILDGRLIDTQSRLDVTKARLDELSAIDFASLPLEQAIKQVKGDGSRVIATFEDPNCGYCKRLGKDLDAMDNITIYTFLYPILSEDSNRKSRNIWCAEDQVKAWNDWIVDAVTPPDVQCDSDVVSRNVAFGQGLGINGTPTIFLANGRRLGGYLPPAQLEQAMAEAR